MTTRLGRRIKTTAARCQYDLPHVTSETVGTSWVEFTLPPGATRADVYFDTNAGAFSYESGTPTVAALVPADTSFVVCEGPGAKTREDRTVQLKAASARTTTYLRVVIGRSWDGASWRFLLAVDEDIVTQARKVG